MLNGDLKSLLSLWENLAQNRRYAPYVKKADIKTFLTRATNEGLPFLTRTLPLIGKALDRFHATGVWAAPSGFVCKLTPNSSGLTDFVGKNCYDIPIFLWDAIWAALSGDSIAVDCVRQLTLIFYKYEVAFDDKVTDDFLQKFEETDANLNPLLDGEDRKTVLGHLIGDMRRLIARALCNTNPYDIRPCHGGGATACHTENKDKWHILRYYSKLDAVYPYSDLFFYSPTHLADELGRLEEAKEAYPQARVCLVPKDSRGPRVISCEPAELMFAQQGLMKLLYETLETNDLTSGQVNFTDQTINRRLACSSSKDGKYATIDLSDASDRVSMRLVELVFPEVWVECFKACRSDTTLLPNGKIVKLNKFAPMGSACCFPVEALVFWACAEATTSRVPSLKNRRSTFVYGDDIIVPSLSFDSVCEGLNLIGLKVNEDKSYRGGPFRESCGGDYHLGVDVTPVRVRKPLLSAELGVVRNADLANLFIAKFGYTDAISLIHTIEEAIEYVFPRSPLALPGALKTEPAISNDVFFKRRWNKDLQRWEYRVLRHKMGVITAHPPNWGELHRMELTKHSSGPSFSLLSNRDENPDSIEARYENPFKMVNSKLEPGQYADVHSAHMRWTWSWLG